MEIIHAGKWIMQGFAYACKHAQIISFETFAYRKDNDSSTGYTLDMNTTILYPLSTPANAFYFSTTILTTVGLFVWRLKK